MCVWLPTSAERAMATTIESLAKPSASHCNPSDSVEAITMESRQRIPQMKVARDSPGGITAERPMINTIWTTRSISASALLVDEPASSGNAGCRKAGGCSTQPRRTWSRSPATAIFVKADVYNTVISIECKPMDCASRRNFNTILRWCACSGRCRLDLNRDKSLSLPLANLLLTRHDRQTRHFFSPNRQHPTETDRGDKLSRKHGRFTTQ